MAFLIGLAATWQPAIPRFVASPLGPAFGEIGQPVSIEIPSLEIEAPVVPIDLVGDVLTPPADVDTVGWWRRSAQPGAREGQTLITGHAVHTGTSAFNPLRNIKRGASVTIRSKNKSASYVVQKVFVWSKPQVAARSEELFDPDEHARRLVLVASANFDGKVWNGNVIVLARPI